MPITLIALLAAVQPLPFIDRGALHTLAKFESLQDVKRGTGRTVRDARLLTELCSLASDTGPAAATADLGRVYSMSAPRVSILKSTCALHRASQPSKLGSR